MTPSEFAAEELAQWEVALHQQRDAEQELDKARAARAWVRVIKLRPQVRSLRTRADLLLAQAVNVKCTFRDHRMVVDDEPTELDVL